MRLIEAEGIVHDLQRAIAVLFGDDARDLDFRCGDVVDVEFELPQKEIQQGEQEAYLLHATGFYTSLSKEGRHTAGNWTDGLDLEERMILSDMYPLEEYQKKNRTPALV